MKYFFRLFRRLRALFRRDALDREMDEEMRFHLAMQARENAEAGVPKDDAEHLARRQFGHLDAVKDTVRDRRGMVWLENLWRDIRFAARSLAKSPAFTCTAALTLGLGLGANTAIFSFINAVMLRPVPVPDPEQMAQILPFSPETAEYTSFFSYPEFAAFRDRSTAFAGIIATSRASVSLTGAVAATENPDGIEESVRACLVSGNYFSVLRTSFAQGRGFIPDEDATPGTHPVAIISHRLWETRFGSDPEILDRTIQLNRIPFRVIGVAAQNFRPSRFDDNADVWVPLMMHAEIRGTEVRSIRNGIPQPTDRLRNNNSRWLYLDGRLNRGFTHAQAQAELALIAAQLDRMNPPTRARRIAVLPATLVPRSQRSGMATGAALFFAGPALVLLVACANVGNLLLARGASRSRELAIRLSLGAARQQLVRQLLTESLLLGLLGGIIGVILATWLARLFIGLMQLDRITPFLDLTPDARVITFALGLSLLAAVLFGLIPSLRVVRPDLIAALKLGGTQSHGGGRLQLQKIFVAAQMALSIVLLVMASLLVRTWHKAATVDSGFALDRLAVVHLDLIHRLYTGAQSSDLLRGLMERFTAIPSIEQVTVASYAPVGGGLTTQEILVENAAGETSEQPATAHLNKVLPDYFATVGQRLVRGRIFSPEEVSRRAKVVVVTDAAAQRFWPGQDPIGRRYFSSTTPGSRRGQPVTRDLPRERSVFASKAPPYEVIGIIAATSNSAIVTREPDFYLPLQFDDPSFTGFDIIVRTKESPTALLPTLMSEVRALDPQLQPHIAALKDRATDHLDRKRGYSIIAASFGAISLLLAAVGLHGVVTFVVRQRTAEIGVRIALGASSADIVRLVLQRGLTPVFLGALAGLGVAVGGARILRSLLFGVGPADPVTYLGVTVVLGVVAWLACWWPVRKATRVDPAITLRAE